MLILRMVGLDGMGLFGLGGRKRKFNGGWS